jgi:porin
MKELRMIRLRAALRRPLVPLAVAFAAAPSAVAQSADAKLQKGLLPVPNYEGDLLKRPALTGDWGGARQEMAEKGVTFDVQWTDIYQGVTNGGIDEGWWNGGSVDYLAKIDLMQMGVVPGALVTARAESRYGNTVNGETGQLLPANFDSFSPLTSPTDQNVGLALTELNWTQFLSEQFGVIAGKITTVDSDPTEFASGRGRDQFMNTQLVFSPAIMLSVPYSTLAAGAIWLPTDRIMVTSLVMNTTDSSTTTGFADFDDGTTWATEADTQYRLGDLPGGMNAGAVLGFHGDYAQIGGRLQFTRGNGVSIENKDYTWAAYWSGWQYLYAQGERPKTIKAGDGRPDLQGVGLFARLGTADQDTNPVEFSASGGLGGRGLIPTRDDDSWGAGVFYSRLQKPRTTPIQANLLDDHTNGFEVFYNVAVLPSVALTLDAQWLRSAFNGIDDATVLGVRLNVTL